MSKATAADLKKSNQKMILKTIYDERKVSNAEISVYLQLSRPTVTKCICDLEMSGFIERNGFKESTGGRKAAVFRFKATAKLAIGVELLRDYFEIAAVDLYGTVIREQRIKVSFKNNNIYYSYVCQNIRQFINDLRLQKEQLLGIGIVLQGLISADGKRVTYGKILDCTGLTADVFELALGYPCLLFHDAESAATIELWENQNLKNAIYFNIRTNLSGAFIVDGQFLKGNNLKSGVFEHMTIVPGGKPCYCGKRGCVDAYCSYPVLLDLENSLECFFEKLRDGNEKTAQKWTEYLENMAAAIDNLRMLIDYDIVLGGTLPQYMNDDDLEKLHKMVADHSAFTTSQDFIRIADYAGAGISRGAALPLVAQYLSGII